MKKNKTKERQAKYLSELITGTETVSFMEQSLTLLSLDTSK